MDAQIKDTVAQRDMYKQRSEELEEQLNKKPGSFIQPPSSPNLSDNVSTNLLQEELISKSEIIDQLKESLKLLTTYKQE